MHIAINGWFWDRPATENGIYVRKLTHALRRLDPALQITLILPAHLRVPEGVPEGVKVIMAGGQRLWFEQRTFPNAAGKAGADIAHIPYHGAPLSAPIPWVITIPDLLPLVMPEYAPKWGDKLYTSLTTSTANGASYVITWSDAIRDEVITRLQLPSDRVTTIAPGIDESFHPRLGAERDPEVRKKYELPEAFVLYHGEFDRRKSINDLLLAYTYVAQGAGERYPLVLAGPEPAWGSTAIYPDLRRYAQDLQISDLVQWIGPIDPTERASLYRLAKVIVMPSVYEGFAWTVLEAMASGTPAIAREIPVMQALVGDGAYLIRDARKMAGAMLALLEQEPFRQTMINQGLAQATRYTWRKTARETLNIYEQVLKA